jgi:hypothetical protein
MKRGRIWFSRKATQKELQKSILLFSWTATSLMALCSLAKMNQEDAAETLQSTSWFMELLPQ